MSFRRDKLFLALGILTLGMTVAVLWHGWQGWGLGRGYPFDSFLFSPDDRFEDLLHHAKAAGLPSPYQDQVSNYFPFTYVVLRPFAGLPSLVLCSLYLGSVSLGLWLVLRESLRPVTTGVWENLFVATAFLALSYPFLVCVDRANLELIMALLTSLSLLCFRTRRWGLGLGFLLPAICLKFYPIVLLALFVRPRHLGKIAGVVVAFSLITIGSLASFAGNLMGNAQLWQNNLEFYRLAYVIEDWGLAGSASPWNTGKAVVVSLYDLKGDPLHTHIYPLKDLIEILYRDYTLLALASILALIAFSVLIEREFYRRAILLLLVVTMIAPNGGDYKLLFAQVALVTLILIPTQRRHDLWATALLALAIIPKKEIFLTYLGTTDTGFDDIPIGILINPPLLLIAMAILIRDGISPGAGKRAVQRLRALMAGILHSKM